MFRQLALWFQQGPAGAGLQAAQAAQLVLQLHRAQLSRFLDAV